LAPGATSAAGETANWLTPLQKNLTTMNKSRIIKVILKISFFITALLLFALVVMLLWNAILPGVVGVQSIGFAQALGLLVLCKILFGGFGGGWQNKRNEWKQKMKDKCAAMTPEQQERFKSEWKTRCSGRWDSTPTVQKVAQPGESDPQ